MTRNVGLWIDHKHAVIVSIDGQGEVIRKVESGAQHHEYRGAPHPKSTYSAQYNTGDDQLDKQYQLQLHKYYEQVVALLRDAPEILIIGPGEAKVELKNELESCKGTAPKIKVEPADRLTERQIVARVRKYFQETQ